MDKRGRIVLVVALIEAAVLIVVATIWYHESRRLSSSQTAPVQASSSTVQATSTYISEMLSIDPSVPYILPSSTYTSNTYSVGDYSVILSDDQRTILIANRGALVGKFFTSDIPSFDTDTDNGGIGMPADPALFYTFHYGKNSIAIDSVRGIIYFSVDNNLVNGHIAQADNSDRAVFSYVIASKMLTVLLTETDSDSFNNLYLSPDDRFLVFSELTNAGNFCNSVATLGVYDTQNKKSLDMSNSGQLDSSSDVVGADEFSHWVTTSSFVYDESSYPNGEACDSANASEKNAQVIQKVYNLQ
jgi:hypothetical protein